MSKQIQVTTIPALLSENRNNVAAVARILGASRNTIYKHRDDTQGKYHFIVDDKIFVRCPGVNGWGDEK
ncbi:helix-turn-helix domain-containing protein [Enterobacter kobei]